MLMHASEIPEGNYWQKVIAAEAIRALGTRDYCGVIHWSGSEQWLWNPGLREIGGYRDSMLAIVDRMVPGDMPSFTPAVTMAHQAFLKVPDAAVKHMIIISDGDPSAPSSGLIKAMTDAKITISTVAVAAHGPAQSQALQSIAQSGGGKFYKVDNPKLLPRIYQREARRVARPLVYERPEGFRPRVRFPHEMLRGIEDPLPPITGFVLTSKKQSPLVETALVSPEPADEDSNTILASWTYGLGKSVAFTSDATQRWTAGWMDWENYDKLFGQMIRWSMRPTMDTGKFSVASDVADGRVRVVVSALDQKDQFLNFLNMAATVVGPRLEPIALQLEQTAPGRYVGAFPARKPGSYFLMISPGAGQAAIRTGVNVPYSDEFRDRFPNDALLEQLAQMAVQGGTAPGGSAGRLLPPLAGPEHPQSLVTADSFRHDLPRATSSQDIWHWLSAMACCIFFADIFLRRVELGFGWAGVLARRVRCWVTRRQPQMEKVETIQRLQSRKAEVAGQIEQRRAATRFQPPEGGPATTILEDLTKPPTGGAKPASPEAPSLGPEHQGAPQSYTERLLRAKKKVWEERGENREEK
jgi:hypothetical protein